MRAFVGVKLFLRAIVCFIFVLVLWQGFSVQASADTYKFPWRSGSENSKRIGPSWWHGLDCVPGISCALDLFAEEGSSDEQREVLAAATGTIIDVKRCPESSLIFIQTGDTVLHYFHIRTRDFPFTEADKTKTVRQGDHLGYIAFGVFDEACGSTKNQEKNGHLHLGIINPPITMDGWSLVSGQTLTKNGATAGVGSRLISTNRAVRTVSVFYENTYQHPRVMGDVDGDYKADAIGFGNAGVYVAKSEGTSFMGSSLWLSEMGILQGWTKDRHVRTVADVNGDGRADVVGFGDRAVYVGLSNGNGFEGLTPWLDAMTYEVGSWSTNMHPRMVADVTGDGKADLVGFGNAGVYVSVSTGSSFISPALWMTEMGYNQGWRVNKHPRGLSDIDGDGKFDLVGFGDGAVYVALSNGLGFTMQPPALYEMGYNLNVGGWRVEYHPRVVGDITGDNKGDLVGFGWNSIYGANSVGNSFSPSSSWLNAMTYYTPDWRVDKHPRMVADVNGDGRDDVVGFGDSGILVGTSTGSSFNAPSLWRGEMGYDAGGWR